MHAWLYACSALMIPVAAACLHGCVPHFNFFESPPSPLSIIMTRDTIHHLTRYTGSCSPLRAVVTYSPLPYHVSRSNNQMQNLGNATGTQLLLPYLAISSDLLSQTLPPLPSPLPPSHIAAHPYGRLWGDEACGANRRCLQLTPSWSPRKPPRTFGQP